MAFLVNSSKTLGLGHLKRCLILAESLSKNNIQSVTIKTNDKYYLIDEVFFTKDGKEARAIKNMVEYGRLIENMTAGKSTYQIIKQKKIKRNNS